jgi:threonine dehydrogenase-like Zn-dependent dehydrogenase
MLAVHFLGHGRISLDQIPKPEPRDQDVLVRIESAAICGTDRENLEGVGHEKVPGHESAGEVVAVDKPTWLRVGDRVAINCHITCGGCEHCVRGDLYFCDDLKIVGSDRDGGFAEFALVPEACCMVLPDDISLEVGSLLVDMLGTSYRGVKQAGLLPGDQVAIWGAGPIGLSALLVASQLDAKVAILDFNEYRLNLARHLGADLALNPVRDQVRGALLDWTEGRGVDVAFECVGNENAAQQALSVVKKRGKLALIGVSDHLTISPWEHVIRQELTIYGTRNFTLPEFDEMIALVRRGLPVEQVVTHRFPLAEVEAAFDLFRSAQCGKVLITG